MHPHAAARIFESGRSLGVDVVGEREAAAGSRFPHDRASQQVVDRIENFVVAALEREGEILGIGIRFERFREAPHVAGNFSRRRVFTGDGNQAGAVERMPAAPRIDRGSDPHIAVGKRGTDRIANRFFAEDAELDVTGPVHRTRLTKPGDAFGTACDDYLIARVRQTQRNRGQHGARVALQEMRIVENEQGG